MVPVETQGSKNMGFGARESKGVGQGLASQESGRLGGRAGIREEYDADHICMPCYNGDCDECATLMKVPPGCKTEPCACGPPRVRKIYTHTS